MELFKTLLTSLVSWSKATLLLAPLLAFRVLLSRIRSNDLGIVLPASRVLKRWRALIRPRRRITGLIASLNALSVGVISS